MSGLYVSPTEINNATNVMDDTEYLLHLEALKRFIEDEKNIRRQVEEQTRTLLETKQEYLTFYEKYVTLLTHIGTRQALECKLKIDDSLVQPATQNITDISAKIGSDLRLITLDEEKLNDCKKKLLLHKACDKLSKQQCELAKNRETIKTIQVAVESVENILEAATIQSLQQLTVDAPADNLQ